MNTSTRLTGDALSAFCERLAAAVPEHAGMIADSTVDVERVPVPASLGHVAVYEVTVHARQRPIEMLAADVGHRVIVLGDPRRVDQLANHVGLVLQTRDEVADYLRFWCRAATRHVEQLVETPADFQWIPGVTTDPELRARADRAAHLARLISVGHPAAGAFPAEVTMLDQRTLHLRQLHVAADGHVDEIGRQVLTTDVPVPYMIP